METYMLAETFGRRAEKYFWYPNASKGDIPKIRKELEGDQECYQTSVTIYYLDGDSHSQDFAKWKEALENRTQTFQRKGFYFHDDNIKKLKPKGILAFTKAPYYD